MVHADIDPRRCCGYRLCVDVAPDVFAINAAGKAKTLVGDIPVGSRGPCGIARVPVGGDHHTRCRPPAIAPLTAHIRRRPIAPRRRDGIVRG
ncbi:ferredoxin [Mycobacterium gallinarum]|uniref:ferredoxin n=1 Tax=Mycobacterium gallinarum TaxID=39689 RepID=UPI001E64E107|nr:ferredoxin [Mycobacterium gallinarum]